MDCWTLGSCPKDQYLVVHTRSLNRKASKLVILSHGKGDVLKVLTALDLRNEGFSYFYACCFYRYFSFGALMLVGVSYEQDSPGLFCFGFDQEKEGLKEFEEMRVCLPAMKLEKLVPVEGGFVFVNGQFGISRLVFS